MSRRSGRRERREQRRAEKRQARSDALGGLEGVFAYNIMYRAGKKCCCGVRWKQSVQRFEARLFSGTAKRRREVLEKRYHFSPYVHFLLTERGKIRPIDAPRIQDRQVQKVYTQKVLLPLYLPGMIYDNGASLPGKGFFFSRRQMEADLREHFAKYGREGSIILTDFEKYFPSASHQHIKERHERLILDRDLKEFGDSVVDTVPGGRGMPLGVEPSQAEMIALPSVADNYLGCQMGLTRKGHYMDDYKILVPPGVDPRAILEQVTEQFARCGIQVSKKKTQIRPLTKPFRYCKAKYILTETGKVVVKCNKTTMRRDRRKIRAYKAKVERGEMSMDDLWTSANGMLAYLESYDEHEKVLELRRMLYAAFGIAFDSYDTFRKGAQLYEIRRLQKVSAAGDRGDGKHPLRDRAGGAGQHPLSPGEDDLRRHQQSRP